MVADILFYSLTFFTVVYIYYYLFYFASVLRIKEATHVDKHLPVSVIICAQNELPNLQKLIPALFDQNYHNFEVVIVNDRSYDGTYDYLEEVKKVYGNLKIVHVEDNKANMDGKKYGLTLGIKAAKNDYLLFTDADCLPANQNWILQMQSQFSEGKKIILGISQYEKKSGLLNLIIRFETLYTTIQYLSAAVNGKPYMGVGRNLAYTKSLFLENKGFHPYMYITGGDDDLFVNRLANSENTGINVTFSSQTVSVPKVTWREWLHQKVRHLSVSKYYNQPSKIFLGILNFSHILVFFLFISVLFTEEYRIFGLVELYVRWLVMIILFSLIAKKLRYSISAWKVIIFDIIFPFYYITVGFKALRNKRIKWN